MFYLLSCNVLYWYSNLLCCAVLYCTVLYCAVRYCAVLYCTVMYFIVLYCAVLYCILLYCIVLYCTVLHSTVLYCTVLCCTVLYCTVLCCTLEMGVFFLGLQPQEEYPHLHTTEVILSLCLNFSLFTNSFCIRNRVVRGLM
jgi:hypothetical protein